jgi:hypothetical protein
MITRTSVFKQTTTFKPLELARLDTANAMSITMTTLRPSALTPLATLALCAPFGMTYERNQSQNPYQYAPKPPRINKHAEPHVTTQQPLSASSSSTTHYA